MINFQKSCVTIQDELGIQEEEFDDLQSLFKVQDLDILQSIETIGENSKLCLNVQMFDVDEDGILNLMEAQHVLRCLGFKGFDADSV